MGDLDFNKTGITIKVDNKDLTSVELVKYLISYCMYSNNIKEARSLFLYSTYLYYNEDSSRRAVNNEIDGCEYKTSDGRMCAIGRFMGDYYSPEFETWDIEGVIEVFYPEFRVLPNYILKLGTDFLYSVQRFHDRNNNWTENGISEEGEENYDYIVREYNLENLRKNK